MLSYAAARKKTLRIPVWLMWLGWLTPQAPEKTGILQITFVSNSLT